MVNNPFLLDMLEILCMNLINRDHQKSFNNKTIFKIKIYTTEKIINLGLAIISCWHCKHIFVLHVIQYLHLNIPITFFKRELSILRSKDRKSGNFNQMEKIIITLYYFVCFLRLSQERTLITGYMIYKE